MKFFIVLIVSFLSLGALAQEQESLTQEGLMARDNTIYQIRVIESVEVISPFESRDFMYRFPSGAIDELETYYQGIDRMASSELDTDFPEQLISGAAELKERYGTWVLTDWLVNQQSNGNFYMSGRLTNLFAKIVCLVDYEEELASGDIEYVDFLEGEECSSQSFVSFYAEEKGAKIFIRSQVESTD